MIIISEILINSTVTQTEKIELEGLDHVVALSRFFIGASLPGAGSCQLPSGTGQGRVFPLHPAWSEGGARKLRGRALDLKAAYKQLAGSGGCMGIHSGSP